MAPRSTRMPAASAARARSKKRVPDKQVASPTNAASPVSVPSAPVVELLSDDEGTLVLPIRFQCPLCFDVLRRPIQLPCCQRHLCEECLQRGLEITSSNCGFCRKRIVGMARKKQYKVDDALWNEIRRCCPFVAHANGAADCVVDVEFVDENAPSKQRMVDAENEAAAVREAELTLSQKVDSHHESHTEGNSARPTLTIAVNVSPEVSVVRTRGSLESLEPNAKHKQQRRLESFFALDQAASHSSRPSSASSTRSLRSTTSSSSNSSTSSRGRPKRRTSAVGKKSLMETGRATPVARSSSHSPKRRKPSAVQRTLLQLTIHSPVGRTTRQSSAASASSITAKGDRPRTAGSMATRPRRPWRCSHCTYENTCFDTRCSMCQHYPANAPAQP